jgi:hypothetical protein
LWTKFEKIELFFAHLFPHFYPIVTHRFTPQPTFPSRSAFHLNTIKTPKNSQRYITPQTLPFSPKLTAI